LGGEAFRGADGGDPAGEGDEVFCGAGLVFPFGDEGVRRTKIGLAAEGAEPFGKRDLVPVDLLPARLSGVVRDMQQALLLDLARLPREQDAAFLERLPDGGQPVRRAIVMLHWGGVVWECAVVEGRHVAAGKDMRFGE